MNPLAKKAAQKAIEYPVLGFNFARFLNFRTQQTFLNLLVRHLPWVDKNLFKTANTQNIALNQIIFKELAELLKEDAKNISEGIYPIQVLKPEPVGRHFWRLPQIVWDGVKIYDKRVKRIHQSFSKAASEYLNDVPEYFRRNYHFQTDGYLSEKSAELYEHQVELLFSGAGDAMRRIMIRPLKSQIGSAENLKFLEIACGTGRATRFMKLAFPKAKIVATDVSRPYLTVARKKLSDLARIDFLQADAAQLPFKDESFDVIYSVFMFHELPPEVREKVLREAFRVLKPGGIFAMVDSVQIKDFEVGKSTLEQFPVDFHEPFYKHYIQNPVETVMEGCGFQFIETSRGFLSKAVLGQKTTS